MNYKHTGREKIMKLYKQRKGYMLIYLHKNGYKKGYSVHRLVAEAFIPNPNNLPQVNHKNEIKDDNRLENLEWCDTKYNINYGTRNERVAEKLKGMKHTEEEKNKISEANSKPVLKIDPISNEIVAEFPSIIEVERQLGFSHSIISLCCNGKLNTAHSFKWAFKKEDF